MPGRVLLLSAGFGSGHTQAAQAIAGALSQLNPGGRAQVVDLQNPLTAALASGYLAMLRFTPALYRHLYRSHVNNTTRRLIQAAFRVPVRREIKRFRPDAVVATHPFPAAVAASMRLDGRLACPVHVIPTDFVPHPLWIHAGVDRYFVASAEAALRLRLLGVPGEQVQVTGIPVRPEFDRPHAERRSNRLPRILVMGGGLGLGPILTAVRSLTDLPHPAQQVTVVCGTNQALARDLTARFGSDPRVEVLGFTDRVPELMRQSDLLVTKPGGITCSEALAAGLPMLLLQPLPGHEEDNAAYLVGLGAAEVVAETEVGAAAGTLLYRTPERLSWRREASRIAGRPEAAAAIAQSLRQLIKGVGESRHQLWA